MSRVPSPWSVTDGRDASVVGVDECFACTIPEPVRSRVRAASPSIETVRRRARVVRVIPSPLSITEIAASSPWRLAARDDGSPAGVWRSALGEEAGQDPVRCGCGRRGRPEPGAVGVSHDEVDSLGGEASPHRVGPPREIWDVVWVEVSERVPALPRLAGACRCRRREAPAGAVCSGGPRDSGPRRRCRRGALRGKHSRVAMGVRSSWARSRHPCAVVRCLRACCHHRVNGGGEVSSSVPEAMVARAGVVPTGDSQ